MTGYDKLREAIEGAMVAASVTEWKFQRVYRILNTITAAGIPIEALANGEMVAVPKEMTEDMAEAWHTASAYRTERGAPLSIGAIYVEVIAAVPKEPAE